MRGLVWLTALVALLYGGYWYVGSRAVLSGATAALVQMTSEGRGDYSTVALHGFPSRFDLTISDPKLIMSDGLAVWGGAFLQIFALSYQPNNIIAVFPHDQSLTLGAETLSLASSDLRASAKFTASLSLPLEHAELEGHDLALVGSSGWSALASKMVFALRAPTAGSASQQMALVLTDLAPGNALRSRLDPTGHLPATMDDAQLGFTVVLDRPLDRSALDTPLHISAVENLDGRIAWGAMSLEAAGDLRADANGFAAGRIALTARNWRDILALAVAAGAVQPDMVKTFENILASLEKGSGEAGVVKLPVTLVDGLILLGPIPIGRAPQF